MTRDKFLMTVDEILGLRPGTLKGNEKLDELESWDSTALISLMVLADSGDGVQFTPEDVGRCSTVADLVQLAHLDEGTV